MNKQREIVYSLRKRILEGEGISDIVEEMIDEKVQSLISQFIDQREHPEDWNLSGLRDGVLRIMGFVAKVTPAEGSAVEGETLSIETLMEMVTNQAKAAYREKERLFGEKDFIHIQQFLMLQIIDNQWISHLQNMDHVKEGIGLRGYGQLDPLREYKKEGFSLFEGLMERIKEETLGTIFRIQLARRTQESQESTRRTLRMNRGEESSKPLTIRRATKKVGRNDPCPCGSGKKFKKCCGLNP
jgi:preprotein translocase subunit SecA